MKNTCLISLFVLVMVSCSWIESHPHQMKEAEDLTEELAIDAYKDLMQKEGYPILSLQPNQTNR
jgi:hypothetical protein